MVSPPTLKNYNIEFFKIYAQIIPYFTFYFKCKSVTFFTDLHAYFSLDNKSKNFSIPQATNFASKPQNDLKHIIIDRNLQARSKIVTPQT